MSNNPWPFVIVALTSLGFLANSMAQQNNQLSRDDKNALSSGLAGLGEPVIGTLDSTAESSKGEPKWPLPRQALQQNPPHEQTATPVARLGGIETSPTPERAASTEGDLDFAGRLGNRFRNSRASRPATARAATSRPAAARLGSEIDFRNGLEAPLVDGARRQGEQLGNRDTQPEIAQVLDLDAADSAKRRSPQAAAPRYPDQSSLQIPRQAAQRESTTSSSGAPTPYDYHDAKYNEPLFREQTTHATSVSIESPAPIGRRSFRANQSLPLAGETKATSGVASEAAEGNEPSAGEVAASAVASFPLMPLWPTMALLASLAANLFLGWVAWDIHARYQDFVEEMNESKSVRERQSRRLRDEPRQERRTRSSEEAEFLNGGLEV